MRPLEAGYTAGYGLNTDIHKGYASYSYWWPGAPQLLLLVASTLLIRNTSEFETVWFLAVSLAFDSDSPMLWKSSTRSALGLDMGPLKDRGSLVH